MRLLAVIAVALLLPGMAAAAELTEIALKLGGHDNITTVLVPFPPVEGERS